MKKNGAKNGAYDKRGNPQRVAAHHYVAYSTRINVITEVEAESSRSLQTHPNPLYPR